MAPSRPDLPQGTLDLLILQIVALGPVHGYGITRRLQQISRDVLQVQQGSLYPALHRLENRGYLVASWKPSDTGRDAKFYRLTAKGRRQLEEESRGAGDANGSDEQPHPGLLMGEDVFDLGSDL
jgi:transcriptional regulator